jgi:hypothetical protein
MWLPTPSRDLGRKRKAVPSFNPLSHRGLPGVAARLGVGHHRNLSRHALLASPGRDTGRGRCPRPAALRARPGDHVRRPKPSASDLKVATKVASRRWPRRSDLAARAKAGCWEGVGRADVKRRSDRDAFFSACTAFSCGVFTPRKPERGISPARMRDEVPPTSHRTGRKRPPRCGSGSRRREHLRSRTPAASFAVDCFTSVGGEPVARIGAPIDP